MAVQIEPNQPAWATAFEQLKTALLRQLSDLPIYADSLAWKNHLLFRDALLKDAGLVEKYSLLKKTLTHDPSVTRELYSVKKTEFILSVLLAAGMSREELNAIRAANL